MRKEIFSYNHKVIFGDYEFIQIELVYYKDTKTFWANLTPGKHAPHSNLITLTYPQDGKRFLLLEVNRFSKKSEDKAIEVFDNNLNYMVEEVKKKYAQRKN